MALKTGLRNSDLILVKKGVSSNWGTVANSIFKYNWTARGVQEARNPGQRLLSKDEEMRVWMTMFTTEKGRQRLDKPKNQRMK